MAWGALKGTLVGGNNSIPNPLPLTGSVVVAAGDLVVALYGQQTALTATACADNLGNTYSAQNAGTLSTVAGRLFYSCVTVAGTLTTINITTTSSTNDGSGCAAVYTGPFVVSPLDATPANLTADITTPYSCPATGTLAQALELCIGWIAAASGTLTAGGGFTRDIEQNQSANISTHISSLAVNATTTQTPTWTGTAPTADVLGTASFKADLTVPPSNKMSIGLREGVPQAPPRSMSLQTWIDTPPLPSDTLLFVPGSVTSWDLPYQPPFPRPETPQVNIALHTPLPLTYVPSRVVDWGTVPPAARLDQTWTNEPPPVVAVAPPRPVNQYDWPLPIQPARMALTWTPHATLAYDSAQYMPGLVEDWDIADRIPFEPWQPPYPTALRSPVVAQKPVNQADWPLPVRAAPLVQTWTQAPFFGTPMPVNQDDWPLPKAAVQPVRTWTQAPQQPEVVVATPKPVNQSDWPLPVRAAPLVQTWTQSPMFAAPVVAAQYIPARVVDWGTMAPASTAPALTWTLSPPRAPAVTPTRPPVQPVTALPMQPEYPVSLRGWTNTTPPEEIVVEYVFRIPYIAPRWPIPHFIYEAAPFPTALRSAPVAPPQPPPVATVTALPPQRASQLPTWFQFPNVALLGTPPPAKPVNQSNWPVPSAAPRKSDGYGFTNSANPATIVVPPKPVNQTDWPISLAHYPNDARFYPVNLRTFTNAPFHGVGPSAPGSGAPRNIPFIATMGAMTAR